MKNNHRKGFSLVEMSVVVLVIGLLIGGIVVGRNVLRNAQLQSAITDMEQYKHAIKLFQEKYESFPGDFTGAQTLWTAAAGCPDIAATNTPATATCNGNGDAYIGGGNGTPTAIGAQYQEQLRVWQHLANGGFISQSYTGTISSTNNELNPGINIPKTKDGKAGISFFFAGSSIGNASVFDSTYRHIMVLGAPAGGNGSTPNYTAALSPSEAFQLDAKADDGRPGTGSVLSYKTTIHASCASGDSSMTATYAATAASEGQNLCALIFITGF
jgi:prepilin-type N-terminal cleavage/methylation domain-containing protein